MDYVHNKAANFVIEKMVTLPSLFTGSPRDIQYNFLESMTICKKFWQTKAGENGSAAWYTCTERVYTRTASRLLADSVYFLQQLDNDRAA